MKKVLSSSRSPLFTFVFFFFLIHSSFLFALSIPPQPDGYVTDKAGILSAQTKAELEQTLRTFENETSSQIVVAIFPSLEKESLEDFSIRLATQWKIGQQGKDNGVILLIFTQDRLMRIEVGYGLEGVLPDALAGQIIRNIITPSFQQGNFDAGVLRGVAAIQQVIIGEFKSEGASSQVSPFPVAIIFYLLLALLLLDLIRYTRYRSKSRGYPQRYTVLEWFLRFAILFFLMKILFEILFWMALSSRGGSYGNRSGFGGGGGGSFGGGGASGRW